MTSICIIWKTKYTNNYVWKWKKHDLSTLWINQL